ncbi:MAG: hypothetical protein U1B80_07320, partial [Anaerolineaceae bacterium]|nr:hypothetical protein [Anaerolineaceae bacterium]
RWLWGGAWAALVALGVDFYNWGKEPKLLFGLPDWLLWQVGLVLMIALVYGILSHLMWEDE